MCGTRLNLESLAPLRVTRYLVDSANADHRVRCAKSNNGGWFVGGRLEGKRVLASAAGQGIGRASALAMAAEGAQVFATDINGDALAELASDGAGQIETFVMDVRNDASVAKGVQRAQPDVLFNCAGFVHSGTILEAEDDDWVAHSEAKLADALEALDDRSRSIVARRWLAERKVTLQALADEYGVSAERIRQIEKNALKKLRKLIDI